MMEQPTVANSDPVVRASEAVAEMANELRIAQGKVITLIAALHDIDDSLEHLCQNGSMSYTEGMIQNKARAVLALTES